MTSALTRASDRVQAWALDGLVGFLRWLSPARASDFGGWLFHTVGPLLPVSRVAHDNLAAAMPELDAAARRRVVRGVWDNLGRTSAELPHLSRLRETAHGPGWEIVGLKHVVPWRAGPIVFVSGHYSNWELLIPIEAQAGTRIAGIYRPASNLVVNALIQRLRAEADGGRVTWFAKGAPGARAAVKHIAGGGALAMLADQKMNDGIPVPFFGRPAMTAPALAYFALKYRAPIIPAYMTRIGPARFRMVYEAPLDVPVTGDRTADVQAIMLAVNQTLERWIRADPAAWLWLHRRWPRPMP